MRYPLLAAGLLLHCVTQAQNPVGTQMFKNHQQKDAPKNSWTIDPSKFKSDQNKPDEEVRLIIRLRAEPVNRQGRLRNDLVEREHQQFKNDLTRISGADVSGRAAPSSTISHEYKSTFNGFALTTTQEVATRITALPYVASVSEDKKVEASYIDSDNNLLIRAPQAWQDFGVTGKNVTIGIIDTGIDYNHPDLGNGFGPSFKVVGGYDFVNNDNDPIDDHGHGTHVAGIAAGNGTDFKGVAPDANLVAYKVLGSGGWGYDSWIIAAIERSADPDQNPDTDDALDVVSMSLGRPPIADDPVVMAVNNAVAKGIVFTIAAGNNGDYFTVDSPGIAEGAITVGATDNYKNTAYFSSKGPTQGTMQIKPEVAAPGVDINSSFPGGKYQTLSGTSMATPHVAGAVALLLEKDPSMTPERVKNVLMESASSGSQIIWDQGAGVINIVEALKVKFSASPASVNFGFADGNAGMVKKQKLVITNHESDSKDFSVSAIGNITQAPFNFSVTPSSFSLSANESIEVEVEVTANSAAIPLLNLPEAYTGLIGFTSGGASVTTPVVLMNAQRTRINFIDQLPNVMIAVGIEGSSYWKPYYPTSASLDLYLPEGKYDFITQYDYGASLVVTEGVATQENIDITLNRSLAKNRIRFKPVDRDGKKVSDNSVKYGTAVFSGTDRNITITFLGYVDSLQVSDMNHYGLEFKYYGSSGSESDFYDIVAGTGEGISESAACVNDPADFASVTIDNPGIKSSSHQQLTSFIKVGYAYNWWTMWNNVPIEMKKRFTLRQTRHKANSRMMGSFFNMAPMTSEPGYMMETADIRAEEGGQISLYQHINQKIVSIDQNDFDYTLGNTIPNFDFIPGHTDSYIYYYPTFFSRGGFNHALGDRAQGNVYYTLYNSDSIVKRGTIPQSMYTKADAIFSAIETAQGIYNLDFEFRDFQTGGKFGVAKVSTVFNTLAPDKNPPYLQRLRILNDGKDTNEFESGDEGTISFNISDACTGDDCSLAGVINIELKIKKPDEQNWTPLELSSQDSWAFSADLPSDLDNGYYALIISAEDRTGNTFAYEVTPAFLVGEREGVEPFSNIQLLSPRNFSINAGTTPVFTWTNIEVPTYIIQISQSSGFDIDVIEANVADPAYTIVDALEEDKTYYWRVRSASNMTERWSPVFQFKSSSLPKAELLTPDDDAVLSYFHADFSWTVPAQAMSFYLDISRKPDFSEIDYTLWTDINNPRYSLNWLLAETKYYWRVRSAFFVGWDTEYSVSETREFTTEPQQKAVPLFPEEGSTVSFTSANFSWQGVDNATYYLEVSTQPDFAQLSLQYYTTEESYNNIWLGEPSTDYYYRVVAMVERDWGTEWVYSNSVAFKTTGLSAPALEWPLDKDESQPMEIVFAWAGVTGAWTYKFELSDDENFSTKLTEGETGDLHITVGGLPENKEHFWRVTPIPLNRKIQQPSGIFSFTTVSLDPTQLLHPENNESDVPLNTVFEWMSQKNTLNYTIQISGDDSFTKLVDEVVIISALDPFYTATNLRPFRTYYWRVKRLITASPLLYEAYSSVFKFSTLTATSVESTFNGKNFYSYPNPFDKGTTIVVQSATEGHATLEIVDRFGKSVKMLSVKMNPGENVVQWDGANDAGENLPAGLYHARIKSKDHEDILRMVKLK